MEEKWGKEENNRLRRSTPYPVQAIRGGSGGGETAEKRVRILKSLYQDPEPYEGLFLGEVWVKGMLESVMGKG